MIYVDANIFILSILNKGDRGRKAKAFLKRIHSDATDACTSYLTWDELTWAILLNCGRSAAVEAGRAFLRISNLRLINVDSEILYKAGQMMSMYGIHPRDAIHAASAIQMGAKMLSEDKDFDKVEGLKRKTLD